MSEADKKLWLVDPVVFAKTTFDYLIIGGGLTGLALASRLAEDTRYKVGVIEAGSYHPDDPLINIPANFFSGETNLAYQWGTATTPQKHAHDREILLPTGKLLGGGSAISFMVYMRGSKAEYDNWEKLGNTGWNWEGLLPYFKKAETFVPQKEEVAFPGVSPSDRERSTQDRDIYHGNEGPLQITYNKTYPPLTHEAVATMNALGIRTNLNPEFGDATGIFNATSSVDRRNGIRSYSANTYLASVCGQGNILVTTNSQATKVLFSPPGSANADLNATGAQFISKGTTFSVHATKEVILSAGSIKTPQLLELSGIGDAKRLATYEISCLLDIPQVGENYQDHLSINTLYSVKQELLKHAPTEDGSVPNDPSATVSLCSFSPLKEIVPEADLAILVQELDDTLKSSSLAPLQRAQFKLQRSLIHADIETIDSENIITAVPAGEPGQSYLTLLAAVSHPYSRGHVHIQSSDPLANPTIDGCFLESTFDIAVLRKNLQFLLKVASTEPLSSYLVGPVLPPRFLETDREYDEFIRETVKTVFHPVGTAAMASRDLGGVVNASLLVYGTCNLRVVDASIIPLQIAAHPQATLYAIAEKERILLVIIWITS